MKWIYLIFVFFNFIFNSNALEIAISFDDAPRRLTGHFTYKQRAEALVKGLKKAKVKEAILYCNSKHINEETQGILKYYSEQGLLIGNHTHSHPSFNEKTFEQYKEDFLSADRILSKYPTFTPYFRFPYLREGNERDKRDKMRKLLKEKNYINAYITVDFFDWYLEDLFRKSLEKKEKVNLEKLKKLYISLAKESLAHYDGLAIKYLGRSPKHILLLHETDIAALFIADLVLAMKSWGWNIITSQEAYSDELAKYLIDKPLKHNPGRVGEVALNKGHPASDVWSSNNSMEYVKKRYNTEVLDQADQAK